MKTAAPASVVGVAARIIFAVSIIVVSCTVIVVCQAIVFSFNGAWSFSVSRFPFGWTRQRFYSASVQEVLGRHRTMRLILWFTLLRGTMLANSTTAAAACSAVTAPAVVAVSRQRWSAEGATCYVHKRPPCHLS
jgi:hypothetical protein